MTRPPSIFSLLTYFRVAEQGMRRFERLACSSLSCVQTVKDGPLTFLGPAHVVAPFQFNHFYDQSLPENEWLSFVNRQHVRAFVGVHDWQTGRLLSRHALRDDYMLHGELDVAALRLVDNGALAADTVPLDIARAYDDVDTRASENELSIIGAELAAPVGSAAADNDADEFDVVDESSERLVGASVGARHNRHVGQRRFAVTDRLLTQGMCGASVVLAGTRRAVGIVEAVASGGPSLTGLAAEVANNAAIIDRALLEDFVDDFHSKTTN